MKKTSVRPSKYFKTTEKSVYIQEMHRYSDCTNFDPIGVFKELLMLV